MILAGRAGRGRGPFGLCGVAVCELGLSRTHAGSGGASPATRRVVGSAGVTWWGGSASMSPLGYQGVAFWETVSLEAPLVPSLLGHTVLEGEVSVQHRYPL